MHRLLLAFRCPSCIHEFELMRSPVDFSFLCPKCSKELRAKSTLMWPPPEDLTMGPVVRWLKSRKSCHHETPKACNDPSLCEKCVSVIESQNVELVKKEKINLNEKFKIEQLRIKSKLEYEKKLADAKLQIRKEDFLAGIDPIMLEKLCLKAFQENGYQVEGTPQTADGGVDGILYKNGKKIILQVKRHIKSIGEPVLRDLYGAMAHHEADSGIVISTGGFSEKAKLWASGKPIELWGMSRIREMIYLTIPEEVLIPASFKTNELRVKKMSKGNKCPYCGEPLRRRLGKHGNFWGCSGYPRCSFTRNLR